MNRYPVIDIFCGIGGLAYGFYLEGFKIIAGIDSDSSCKCAFEKNNRAVFIEEDISKLESASVADLFPKNIPNVLIGCAPCQPFSSYTNKLNEKDKRQWSLLESFGRLVKDIQPSVITMENVPSLGTKSIFKEFIQMLNYSNYFVSLSNVNAQEYGVPQQRLRLVLLASKYGEVDLIPPTHTPEEYVTVRDAIGYLPPIGAGETHIDDPMHKSSNMSSLNKKRIKSSVPGGTWQDWNEDLLAVCHKKCSGRSYYNVYGRMEWDKISPTITTQFIGFGNGRFGHPEQDRALSIREGALLQTFPRDYEFVEWGTDYYITQVAKHIGNAVPVNLARAIAKSIRNHLEDQEF